MARLSTGGRVLGAGLLLLLVAVVALLPVLSRRSAPVVEPAPAAPPTPAASALGDVTAYREAIVGLPASLNPLLASADAERDIARLVFASLTQPDGRGGVVADLAERWEVGEGGRVYTFTLRPGLTWHDGRPLTARDVVFTVRLMQDPGFPGDRGLGLVWRAAEVVQLDDRRVRFTLNEPYAPFLIQASFPVLPAHRLHGVYPGDLPGHEFGARPVGAGPYRVVEGLREGDLLLERHAGYHGARPQIERLLLRFYADLDEAVVALRSGSVDSLAGVPSARLDELRAEEGLNIYTAPLNGYSALLFNLRRPLFQQRELRQAFAMAIDRPALVDEALGGLAQPLAGPVLASSWAYSEAPPSGTIHEARALLERLGWLARADGGGRERDGRPLALTLVTSDSPERNRVAAVIARQLGELGVQVTISTLPPGDLVARHLAPHDFDLALIGWSALGEDPDPYSLWHSSQAEQGYNLAGWSLPRADELLESARLTADPTARRERYAGFQKLFAEEAPSVILYSPYYHLVVNERVRNVRLTPLNRPADRFRLLDQWTVEAQPAVG